MICLLIGQPGEKRESLREVQKRRGANGREKKKPTDEGVRERGATAEKEEERLGK